MHIWNLDQFGNSLALIDDNSREMSYAELAAAGENVAQMIGSRCLVFCFCRNQLGSIVGYVGSVNNGIVPLLISADMEEGLIESLIQTYHPSYLWLPLDVASRYTEMTVVFEAYGYVLLSTGLQSCSQLYENLCLLLTTSGSTGSPKLVRQSYVNVLDNAQSIVNYLALDETERPVTTLPMNYTYGLSIINSHLLVGATILVTQKGFTQRDFWEFFCEKNATSFGGVPYTYEMLDRLRFYGMDLPSLRTITQAGGKLSPELHMKFAKYARDNGKQFIVMYGQCEATARMGYLPAEKALDKKGSMGIAIPGGKFSLVDSGGRIITESFVTGELVYEGKNVTLGYAESAEDLSKGDERSGVLRTGDMAQFDNDGYFYIVGRKKRFLKVYGNRVNLDELERMVKGRFGIEIACAGVDDHAYLFVTKAEDAALVKDYVVAKTRLNPTAFEVKVLESIPKNEAGKTLYSALSEHYD